MLDTRSADHNDYEVETPEYVRHGVLVMQAVLFAETELEHARILFGEIGAEPGAHYVDMGCGTGEVGRLFCRFDPAASITGVTNSAVQCALVQQRGMRSIRADFHQVPLPDDCADVVMFNESIGYGDLTGLLREAHRLLRRGGRLFIKDWYVSTTRYVADWDYVWHDIGSMATALCATGFDSFRVTHPAYSSADRFVRFMESSALMQRMHPCPDVSEDLRAFMATAIK